MNRRILFLTALPLVVGAFAGIGCLSEGGTQPGGPTADGGSTPITDGGGLTTPDATTIETDAAVEDPTTNDAIKDSTEYINYLDILSNHPGCTTADLATRVSADGKPANYAPAVLPDFPCAAQELVPPVDSESKPLVILVHGNSSTPRDFYTNADDPTKAVKQIADVLVNDSYHVFLADFRFDKVYNLAGENSTVNSARNMDHGWTVPILEALIRSVHKQYPNRKINMAGFSLGPTVIRDALRRMHHRGEAPFKYIHALHLVSGANHGVSTYPGLCPSGTPSKATIAAYVACQMGNRESYNPTAFSSILNGPDGAWETPCADGLQAYGQNNVCGGNIVLYTTAVHSDKPDGTIEDQFVSQTSASLKGADNRAIAQDDTSGYFFNGYYAHHYGALRSQPAVDLARQALER